MGAHSNAGAPLFSPASPDAGRLMKAYQSLRTMGGSSVSGSIPGGVGVGSSGTSGSSAGGGAGSSSSIGVGSGSGVCDGVGGVDGIGVGLGAGGGVASGLGLDGVTLGAAGGGAVGGAGNAGSTSAGGAVVISGSRMLNAVVVSMFVPVGSGVGALRGTRSPGAWIVEVTPLTAPSSIT